MTDTAPSVIVVEDDAGVVVVDLVPDVVAVDVVVPDLVEVIVVNTGAPGPPGPAGELLGVTVDTGEDFRIILFSDGTTRAIPVAAVAPALPTGLARTVRINSVRLTWTAAAGAASYIVRRNGSSYATSATTSYRDTAVTVGETYTYSVQAVSGYGLRSAVTATVSAFIDPALNVAPTVEVRTWPATVAAGNRAVVRVNAADVDAQLLALALGVDVGSLVATADPSVWTLEP